MSALAKVTWAVTAVGDAAGVGLGTGDGDGLGSPEGDGEADGLAEGDALGDALGDAHGAGLGPKALDDAQGEAVGDALHPPARKMYCVSCPLHPFCDPGRLRVPVAHVCGKGVDEALHHALADQLAICGDQPATAIRRGVADPHADHDVGVVSHDPRVGNSPRPLSLVPVLLAICRFHPKPHWFW